MYVSLVIQYQQCLVMQRCEWLSQNQLQYIQDKNRDLKLTSLWVKATKPKCVLLL